MAKKKDGDISEIMSWDISDRSPKIIGVSEATSTLSRLFKILQSHLKKTALTWNFDTLPVPTDILIYTMKEWQDMRQKGGKFVDMIEKEAVWLYPDNRFQ
jgi:hypothetical protein